MCRGRLTPAAGQGKRDVEPTAARIGRSEAMKSLAHVFAFFVTVAVLAGQDVAALNKAISEYECAKEVPARIRALEAIAALPADVPADKRTRALARGLAASEPGVRL